MLSNMATNNFKVSIVISSVDVPAEKLVEIFGESTIRRKGEAVSSSLGAPLRDHSAWIRESALSDSSAPEEQVLDLIDLIERKFPSLIGIREHLQIDIWCMVTNEADQCGFSFSFVTLEKIAGIGANLIFDVYR